MYIYLFICRGDGEVGKSVRILQENLVKMEELKSAKFKHYNYQHY